MPRYFGSTRGLTIEGKEKTEYDYGKLYALIKGRYFAQWIDQDGRDNGYNFFDVVSNPAYIIESLLRDELGMTTADIDVAAFDEIGNANLVDPGLRPLRFSGLIAEQESAWRILEEIAVQSHLILSAKPDGKYTLAAPEQQATVATLVAADFATAERGYADLRVEWTPRSMVRNAFFLNYALDHEMGNFTKQMYVADIDADGQVESNLIDPTGSPRHDDYPTWVQESVEKYGPGEEPWELDASWIRFDTTAQIVLKLAMDHFAFRKIIVRANLARTLKTIALEPFRDAVKIDVDKIPSTHRNSAPFRMSSRALPGLGMTMPVEFQAEFVEVPSAVTGMRIATGTVPFSITGQPAGIGGALGPQ